MKQSRVFFVRFSLNESKEDRETSLSQKTFQTIDILLKTTMLEFLKTKGVLEFR